jgi:hypothetical protein
MSEIPQVECPAWASILGALGVALAVGLTGIYYTYVLTVFQDGARLMALPNQQWEFQ